MADFIGTGWAFPPGVTVTGGIGLATGHHKIEQAMRLILATYPGERPMRPLFGSRLRDYVFSGATQENAAAIRDVVTQSLEQWEPRADITGVDVYPDADRPGLLYIDIHYLVPGTNDPRNLVFPFYTIPGTEGEE